VLFYARGEFVCHDMDSAGVAAFCGVALALSANVDCALGDMRFMSWRCNPVPLPYPSPIMNEPTGQRVEGQSACSRPISR